MEILPFRLQVIKKKYLLRLFESLLQQLIAFLISLYQKYISPFKGFSCAYRVLYNDESCSCYVKRIFLEQDLIAAVHMSRERFRECSEANNALKNASKDQIASILTNFETEVNKAFSGRRKFVQNIMLGSVFPIFGQARFQCCIDMCAGSNEDDDSE